MRYVVLFEENMLQFSKISINFLISSTLLRNDAKCLLWYNLLEYSPGLSFRIWLSCHFQDFKSEMLANEENLLY